MISYPPGIRDAVTTTIRNEGIRGFYPGIGAVLVGGVPGIVIYISTYEKSRDFLAATFPVLSRYPSLSYLCSGMIAEIACCTVFVPVDVIKERLQIQSIISTSTTLSSDQMKMKYRGSYDALRTIVRSEGLRGIYKGYGATLLSYGPFSALYFLLYEEVSTFFLVPTVKWNTYRCYPILILPQSKKAVVGNLLPSSDTPIPFTENLLWYGIYITTPINLFLIMDIIYSSAFAGAVASFVTNPLDLAKLRYQVHKDIWRIFESSRTMSPHGPWNL